MKLENQVTSLELSKQLKELGVPQDSLFYWRMLSKEDGYELFYGLGIANAVGEYEPVSAFTVAELGEMLPMEINVNTSYGLIEIEKIIGAWRVFYFSSVGRFNIHTEIAETEADARAKMLIWLVENGYLQLESEGQDDNK